ncbi:MAG: bifunctional metallophosphatase/5'-nucleotidase [bacterium]|nr:bifunctional metallophosphatase/5'-nucleotidase [bacterium]
MRNQQKVVALLFILLLVFSSCKNERIQNTDTLKQIIILYTNDEHGWMQATTSSGGAAGMVGLWKENEGYTADGPFLILSGGDVYTGPAISTWAKGKSMIEVMNAMNYNAAAIGNHEFDFRVSELNLRVTEANFPFLAANIRNRSDNQRPGFASAYTIQEVNGVKIGIIGLASRSTPYTAFPDFVEDYSFTSYANELSEIVPIVKNEGAKLLILIAHLCRTEMTELSSTAANLGISLIGGGHCHETVNSTANGVALIESGSNLKNYVRVEIMFDTETDSVNSITKQIRTNSGGPPDPDVAAVVSKWENLMNEELDVVIGYAAQEIAQNSPEMFNMIADSWLVSFPSAHVAISNDGGVRQAIDAGDITLATLLGVLPFENTILQLELTGEQLIACLDESLFIGGMTTIGGYNLADGTPIDTNTVYTVLVTDYIYSAYTSFPHFDSTPINTGVLWRQPVIDWIESLDTSAADPLENYLDYTIRQ